MKLIADLQKEENMTRGEVNKALPTLQAFAEGKVIQMLDYRSIWTDLTEMEGLPIGTLGESPNIFRIKPAPKYRPFKDAKECWQEMLKHLLPALFGILEWTVLWRWLDAKYIWTFSKSSNR